MIVCIEDNEVKKGVKLLKQSYAGQDKPHDKKYYKSLF